MSNQQKVEEMKRKMEQKQQANNDGRKLVKNNNCHITNINP